MSVKHTELPSDDLIAFALTEAFGEKCPDFDPDCYTCRAWAKYDAVQDLVKALEACQAALALVVEPKAIKSSSVLGAFTQAFEADCKARSALAKFKALSAENGQ